MKPGDHPDFFRFPAPPGQTRESSLRLDRQGRFWHGSERVEHEGMARAFASWMERHPDNGRYILNNGFDWTYIQVEDTPFFVLAVRACGGEPIVQLSDGTEEPLAAATATVGEEDALCVSVKQGNFEARFTPQAQVQLEPFLRRDEKGRVCLAVGDRLFTVRSRNG